MTDPAVFEEVDGGVRIALYVQPRASRTGIVGVFDHRLKVRIAAPPVDAQANEALIRFLAKAIGLPRTSVALVEGRRSRRKTVLVQGLSAAAARARLLP